MGQWLNFSHFMIMWLRSEAAFALHVADFLSCTNLPLPRILWLMSVVLRNWARQVRSLSGFPRQRGPFVTPEMCPHFLLMSMAEIAPKSSTPKYAFAPVSESLHPGIPLPRFIPRIFFPPKTVSFFTLGSGDVIRLSLAYLGLLSW